MAPPDILMKQIRPGRKKRYRNAAGDHDSSYMYLRIALHLTMTVINLFDSCPRKRKQRSLPFGVCPFLRVFPCTLLHRTGYS